MRQARAERCVWYVPARMCQGKTPKIEPVFVCADNLCEVAGEKGGEPPQGWGYAPRTGSSFALSSRCATFFFFFLPCVIGCRKIFIKIKNKRIIRLAVRGRDAKTLSRSSLALLNARVCAHYSRIYRRSTHTRSPSPSCRSGRTHSGL